MFDHVGLCDRALGSGEREVAGKDAEPTQHLALRFGQELIAPTEHGAQGPVPRQCRPPTATQQAEALVEVRREPLDPESVDTAGRELDRKRNAVQPAANLRYDRRISVAQDESTLDVGHAFDE